MKLKKIYNNSPILAQNLMISIYGRKLMKERYTQTYKNHLNFLRENFYEINHYELQKRLLNEFMEFVKENSPYYKEKYKNLVLPINSSAVLKDFEVLTKEDIRKNLNEIITAPQNSMISSFTGGTTGKSLNIFYENGDFEKRMAFLDFFKERHGVLKGMKRASFTGKDLVPMNQRKKVYWRFNFPLNQMLFSSFHLNEENIPYYVKELNRFKPKSLDGFPSVMVTLAKYIIKNDIKLSFKPIAIFPTAETITEYDRELIEKAFDAKVRNQYASSEGAPFITECKLGNLHLDIMTGIFERVDDNNSISEIYVTAFETKGTPLIRYKIGDMLEFTKETCNCGYNTPIVKKIIGRNMDFLYSKDRGKISSANMSNTIKNLPNSVINIQFVQDSVDVIKIKLIVDKELYTASHELDILYEMRARLGEEIQYQLEYVDEIKVEKSGKYKMIKSSLLNKIEL